MHVLRCIPKWHLRRDPNHIAAYRHQGPDIAKTSLPPASVFLVDVSARMKFTRASALVEVALKMLVSQLRAPG